MMKVLLTGAAGRIGQTLLPSFQEAYALRTFDRVPVEGDPDAIIGDVADREAVRRAVDGVDVVVHLAANPSGRATFDELLGPNLIGVNNVIHESSEARVRRVVFASTCQTVTGYPPDRERIDETVYPRPESVYGATKTFGELVGCWYHDNRGLEFVAVRIGAFQKNDSPGLRRDTRYRQVWLSPADAIQIFHKAVETPGVGLLIVSATSQTEFEHLSLQKARDVLGYEPHDNLSHIPITPGRAT